MSLPQREHLLSSSPVCCAEPGGSQCNRLKRIVEWILLMTAHFFINTRILRQPPGGVRRYTHEIARRMRADALPLAPARPLRGVPGHLWEQFVLPRRALGGPLWSPANTGPLQHRRQVLTIHDLGPIDHPEWYRPVFAHWYRWLWPRLVHRVRTILAPSAFSKGRIVGRLGVPAENVRVVHGGVDRRRFKPRPGAEIDRIRRVYRLERPYLLFVGDVQPRKNLAGLAAAWRLARPPSLDAELVIAGAPGRSFRRPGALPGARLRTLGRVAEDDLPALYSGALLFVQPSFYEGGGLTVLEALSCGCPVAASGNTGVAEYLGGAGWTFDPAEPGALAGALRDLLKHTGDLRDYREAGIERAREFSWARAADGVRRWVQAVD